MNFVPYIKGKRALKTLSAPEFRNLVLQRKCTPSFTYQEHFTGDKRVACYYDWDGKLDAEPAAEDLDAHFTAFKVDLEKIHPGKVQEASFAKRHGWIVVDGQRVKYKISFRAWFPTVRATVTDIPLHVRATLGLSAKAVHANIDLSVYKGKEQLLGCIGGTKDIDEEKRYLVPIDADGVEIPWEAVAFERYLAQNPSADAVDLVVSSGSAGSKKRGRKAKAVAGGSAEAAAGGEGDTDVGSGEGKITFTKSDVEAKGAIVAANAQFGPAYRMQEELLSIIVDKETKSAVFPTKDKWCFKSLRRHNSNNPYIALTEAGARFKCPNEQCAAAPELPLLPFSELRKPLKEFFIRVIYAHVNGVFMTEARDECKQNITEHFPEEDEVDVEPSKDMFTALTKHQKCKKCRSDRIQVEHTLQGWHLRCMDCNSPWPRRPVQVLESDFPKLFAVLTQMNVSINTYNNITVNNYAAEDTTFVDTYEEDGLVMYEDPAVNTLFLAALKGTDSTLARYVFALYRDEFHCCKTGAKGTDGSWYRYVKHHWENRAELALRTLLGEDEFLKPFRQAGQHFERNCIQTEDTKRKARHIKRVCEQLEDGSRRKRVVDDAIELFHKSRPDFAEELDRSNMAAFENGVFDFNTMQFREGKPEDMLSVQLRMLYQPRDQQSADCAFVMDFMTSIQPDQETCDYLLTVLSLCLTTNTKLQLFWILTGTGANGKSKLTNFLMAALGDFYGTAPAALLTRRREDANQANESLSALERVRIAVFSEGSASEVLQAATMKLFSGEDMITTRGLHEKQRRWVALFKCFLVCNDIPKIDENTWGTWRRMKVIKFETSFVEDPIRPHERQKDPEIGEKLAKCTSALIAILIEYLGRFKKRGLIESEKVTAATEKYQTDNDVFEEFRSRYIVERPGARMASNDLYARFVAWAERSRKRIPRGQHAIKALISEALGKGPGSVRFGPGKNDTIHGWNGLELLQG